MNFNQNQVTVTTTYPPHYNNADELKNASHADIYNNYKMVYDQKIHSEVMMTLANAQLTAILAEKQMLLLQFSEIVTLRKQLDEMKLNFEKRTVDAENKAESAEKRAKEAEKKAESAEKRAESAENKAESAEKRAKEAEEKAESAEKRAESAEKRAKEAEDRAIAAEKKSDSIDARLTAFIDFYNFTHPEGRCPK